MYEEANSSASFAVHLVCNHNTQRVINANPDFSITKQKAHLAALFTSSYLNIGSNSGSYSSGSMCGKNNQGHISTTLQSMMYQNYNPLHERIYHRSYTKDNQTTLVWYSIFHNPGTIFTAWHSYFLYLL